MLESKKIPNIPIEVIENLKKQKFMLVLGIQLLVM